MNEQELKRLLRRIVLGASAVPLIWLPGCGRSELPIEFDPDASVIPSRDAGRDAGPSDAGRDAGPGDAGQPDAGRDWTLVYPFSCNPGGPAQTSVGPFYKDGGVMLDPSTCLALCGADGWNRPITECTPASSWELVCWGEFCAIGRLAEGVETHSAGAATARAFASMAAHEAAAVVAFEQLALELSRHGLPEPLQRGALRAAREERRHTRLVGALARSRGGQFGLSRAACTEVRSLEALALDNAVEGCTRETFGAMVGLYQSRHAPDPSVRAVMASVSEDELGHAAWSWALAEELNARLPLSSRRKVREAREASLHTLTRSVLAPHSAAERVELGLPGEATLEAMATALRAVT
jgi:hypothetical protein